LSHGETNPAPDAIDDVGPMTTERPADVPQLSDLVRRAAADGQAVYPVGGGTLLHIGLPPERPGVVIDTRGLDRVCEYPARDMTITVQAGITVARLRDALAAENQWLPVDVPNADRATLGGALAANVSGPRRFGFGTFRDYVIGLSAVNDEGHEIKGGGRVVKNVAGYDLPKLYVGSLGTLGVITQVTLKVKPRPEEQSLVAFGCDEANLGDVLDRLHASRTRPVAVELLNRAAAAGLPDAPWVVVVGFEDSHDAVTWQVQQLIKELRPTDGLDVRAGYVAAPLCTTLAEHTSRPDAVLTFRAAVLPRRVADFCRKAAALPTPLAIQAHAANGVVIGHALGGLTLDEARAMLTVVRDAAVAGQGNFVVPRCPPAWKRELPVWGVPRGDLALMRTVKERLDPRRLFNPGRFVDGI
jgi:glycolate oxidase FAD binding subunit